MGLPRNSWSPITGISDSRGKPNSEVPTPVVMPVLTITSERRKPVSPRANRLITTPPTIWFTPKRMDSTARRAATSPPASTEMRMENHSHPVDWASPMVA